MIPAMSDAPARAHWSVLRRAAALVARHGRLVARHPWLARPDTAMVTSS